MKNRRIVIVAFLLTAVLCLGVGYANVSDSLLANGTVSVNEAAINEQFDADVKFVASLTAATKQTGVTADLTDTDNLQVVIGDKDEADDDDKVTVTVGENVFTDEGQWIEVYVKVVNTTAATPVYVSVAPVSTTLTDFTFTMTPVDPGVDASTALAASGEREYAIKITMDKLPSAAITNGEFSFTLTATNVAP